MYIIRQHHTDSKHNGSLTFAAIIFFNSSVLKRKPSRTYQMYQKYTFKKDKPKYTKRLVSYNAKYIVLNKYNMKWVWQ